MRSVFSLGVIALTLATSPAPSQADVVTYRLSSQDLGCFTRGLRDLEADHSVNITPDPAAPGGRGAIVTVDRDALHSLIRELAGSSRACTAQVLDLLSPPAP